MGFQFILILGLLGMYFDAAVVFVMTFLLLFRLVLAILWFDKLLNCGAQFSGNRNAENCFRKIVISHQKKLK